MNNIFKEKNSIYYFLKTMIFLFLLFSFGNIFISLLPIDVKNLSNNYKILLLFISDILFLGLIILGYFKTLKSDLKSFFKDFFNNIEIAFKYWLIGFIVMIISNLIIVTLTKGAIAQNEETIRSLLDLAPIYMLFSVSIYAPLTEELIFRKGFRDFIKNKWLYILFSGGIFGSLHVISSITSPIDIVYLIPYCSLGITFAYTYYKTKNIFSTISMHCFHNTISAILYLIGSGL